MIGPVSSGPGSYVATGYGSTGNFVGTRAQGTKGAETAVTAGNLIAGQQGYAYDGAAYANVAAIQTYVTETQAVGAHGAGIFLRTTKDGATTLTTTADFNFGGARFFTGGLWSSATATTQYTVAGRPDSLMMVDRATTPASGAYGTGLAWSKLTDSSSTPSRMAGVTSRQTTADADQVGLAFWTHPDTVTATAMWEHLRLSRSGDKASEFFGPTYITHDSDQADGLTLQQAAVSSSPRLFFYNTTSGALTGARFMQSAANNLNLGLDATPGNASGAASYTWNKTGYYPETTYQLGLTGNRWGAAWMAALTATSGTFTDGVDVGNATGEHIRINPSGAVGDVNYLGVAGNRAFFGYDGVSGSTVMQGITGKYLLFATNNATFGSGEIARFDSTSTAGLHIGTTFTAPPASGLRTEGQIIVEASGLSVLAGTTAVQGLTATTGTFSDQVKATKDSGAASYLEASSAFVARSGTAGNPVQLRVLTDATGLLVVLNSIQSGLSDLPLQVKATAFGPYSSGSATLGTSPLPWGAAFVGALTATTGNFSGLLTASAGIALTGTLAYANLPTGGGTWANGGALSITGGVTTVAGLSSSADPGITLTTAASRIVPGATSLALRNNANNANNLIILDAGGATFRTTVDVTTELRTPQIDTVGATDLVVQRNNVSMLTLAATNFLYSVASSGGLVYQDVQNSSNTATSSAGLSVRVAGTTAQDALVSMGIVGTGTWAWGLDNSASDALKLSWQTATTTPSDAAAGTVAMTVSTAGLVTANLGLTVTSGQTLTLSGTTVTGAPTWGSNQAITLSTAAQPNITSVGRLASLALDGGVGAGDITTFAGNLTIVGVGGQTIAMKVGSVTAGTFSESGLAVSAFNATSMSKSPAAGASGYLAEFDGTITEAGSGNHALLAGIYVNAPTITAGAATVTDTASLYVEGPPTATVTGNNYAIRVGAGILGVVHSIIVGSPTGGDKGDGTINAVAVYDDNVLLTDYVFEAAHAGMAYSRAEPDGWRLRSLEDIEEYTKLWNHLPGSTRQNEPKRSLGQNTNFLVEKLEEAYLHLFDMNRRLQAVESRLLVTV